MRGSGKKQLQRLGFYVETQFGENYGEEGKNSLFSEDYNVLYIGKLYFLVRYLQ